MRWGMVINLVKCTRCHACIAACRIEHFLPLGMTWPKLIAWETNVPGQELSTVPVRCNQCQEAPCVDVCPAEATIKRDDGIVFFDNNTSVVLKEVKRVTRQGGFCLIRDNMRLSPFWNPLIDLVCRLKRMNEEQHDLWVRAIQASYTTHEVRKLLDLSEIKDGKVSLNPAYLDLNIEW
jgi:ferredoxin